MRARALLVILAIIAGALFASLGHRAEREPTAPADETASSLPRRVRTSVSPPEPGASEAPVAAVPDAAPTTPEDVARVVAELREALYDATAANARGTTPSRLEPITALIGAEAAGVAAARVLAIELDRQRQVNDLGALLAAWGAGLWRSRAESRTRPSPFRTHLPP